MNFQVSPQSASKVEEASASGLEALASVARRLGLHLDVGQMMRDNQLSGGEVSSTDLMRCAASVGLRAKGLRPGWGGLLGLANALPAIVRLQEGGMMVLLRVDRVEGVQRVQLQEPGLEGALLSLDYRQFSAIWSGELLLIQRSSIKIDEARHFSFGLVTSLIMSDRKMVGDIGVAALMLSLLALSPIMFWRLLSERVLQFHAMSTFVAVCLVWVVLVGFETCFGVLRRSLLLRLTTRVDVKLTTDMFARVLALPVDYFERTPAGLTMHKMGQMSRVRQFLVGQLFGTLA